jgi:hypothetical protein
VWALIGYRTSRALYLALGDRLHAVDRLTAAPAMFVLRPWLGTLEIY